MPPEECPDHCSDRIDKCEQFQHDTQKPSGTLDNLWISIGERVKLRIFIYILLIFVGVFGGLLSITYSKTDKAQDEHKNLATKAEVTKLDEKVEIIQTEVTKQTVYVENIGILLEKMDKKLEKALK